MRRLFAFIVSTELRKLNKALRVKDAQIMALILDTERLADRLQAERRRRERAAYYASVANEN